MTDHVVKVPRSSQGHMILLTSSQMHITKWKIWWRQCKKHKVASISKR